MRLFAAVAHPLILDSVKVVCRAFDAAAHVTAFATIAELEAALDRLPAPDLVLIDFDLPGLASVEAIADFIDRHGDARIAVISAQADSLLARDLIRSGCLGFLPASLPLTAVCHAIRLMADGIRFVPAFLADTAWPEPLPAAVPPHHHRLGLTRREVEIVRSYRHPQDLRR